MNIKQLKKIKRKMILKLKKMKQKKKRKKLKQLRELKLITTYLIVTKLFGLDPKTQLKTKNTSNFIKPYLRIMMIL